MDREGGRVRRGGPESLEYDYCDLMMLIPYIPGVTETCKYRHMTHRSIGKRYRNINIWPVLKIENISNISKTVSIIAFHNSHLKKLSQVTPNLSLL